MRRRPDATSAVPTRLPIFESWSPRRRRRVARALPAVLLVVGALAVLTVPEPLAWIAAAAGVAVLLRAAVGRSRDRG